MEQTAQEFKNLNIQRRIWRIRHEGISWTEVADKIKEEFDIKYSNSKIQDMYNEYASRETVIADTIKNSKKEADKVSKEWREEINELIEILNNKVRKYLDMADNLMVESYDSGNRAAFFKDLPAFNNLLRSLQKQVELLKDTQSKIIINQKNVILNDTQIFQSVNKVWREKERQMGQKIHPGTNQIISLHKK